MHRSIFESLRRNALARIRNGGWKTVSSFIIATAVPTFIFTSVALNRPVSFDGAMNLQVAQNVAENGQYARNYARDRNTDEEKRTNTSIFPNEVETNGPYIVTAALGIKIFGQTQLGFQFANLFFLLGTAAVVWWMLKRWIIIATIAPAMILLLLPAPFDATLGGYGEIPALFFAVLSMALIAHTVTLKDKTAVLRLISIAFIMAGASVVTKTYLVGFVPALLLGVLLLKQSKNLSMKPLLARLPLLIVVPAFHEIWHMLSRGSVVEYLIWWKYQLKAILLQSGLRGTGGASSGDHHMGLWDKLMNQTDIFLGSATLAPIILVSLVVVSIAVYVACIHRHRNKIANIARMLANKHGLLLIMLMAMFITYFVWWLVLLPESKTFIRRTLPVMLPVEIALALVVGIGTSIFSPRTKRNNKKFAGRGNYLYQSSRAIFYIAIVGLVLFTIPLLKRNLDKMSNEPYITVSDYEETVSAVRGVPENAKIYGVGWWSAPVVSLMADRNFYNLDLVDPCAISSGKDVIVWDKISSALTASPKPKKKAYDYQLRSETGAGKIYYLSPKQTCDNHKD